MARKTVINARQLRSGWVMGKSIYRPKQYSDVLGWVIIQNTALKLRQL
jgi:hypothetical protein